jgi:hypothetical protein
MANNDSNDGNSLTDVFSGLSTTTALIQAARAFSSGNTGRAALLVASVLIGRRYPRIGSAIQVADTINEIRKEYL